MFDNLIESTSHANELKRRGSFLLFTTVTYVVLIAIAGVASVYAYDARLEEQTLEVVTLLAPQEIVLQQKPAPTTQPEQRRKTSNNSNAIAERAVAILSVNHPEIVPETPGTTPNKNPELPEGVPFKITGRNLNPGSAGDPGSGGGRQIVQPAQVVKLAEQPPPDIPKPTKVVSKGVITAQAIFLPKPVYPEMARKMGIQGSVSVQVLVDESGYVVSANVVSGSPFFTTEARKAALQARFSPTMLSNQRVKVSGVITYNFVLSD